MRTRNLIYTGMSLSLLSFGIGVVLWQRERMMGEENTGALHRFADEVEDRLGQYRAAAIEARSHEPVTRLQATERVLMQRLFDLRMGWLFGSRGRGALMLTTFDTDGNPQRTVLNYRRRNGAFYVFAWPGLRPQWFERLEQHREAMAHIGLRRFPVDARLVSDDREKFGVIKAFYGTLNSEPVRSMLGLEHGATREQVHEAIARLPMAALQEIEVEEMEIPAASRA